MLAFVSVIMPSFNTASFVRESVQSVMAQTFTDWELLIVDDCSSDSSEEVIRDLLKIDNRIKYFRLSKNSGAAVARNHALETAQGHYIAFLDSDDLWLPHKLERQIDLMRKNNWPLSFTAYDKIDEQGKYLEHVGTPEKISYSGLLKTNIMGCLTAMYDTQYFGKVPMPPLRKRQDYGLWLTLLKKTPYAYGISETLAQYRVRQDSISANKGKAALYNWKLYREVEKLSLLASCWYFAHYAVRGVLRSKFPRLARTLGVLH